jgi:tetratricopeptide (TPR) repeat protein
MKTIFADYNAATESGHLRLNCKASREDIAKARVHPGDWAWLSDGEVIVGAQLAIDDRYGIVGIPDWETLVHLDDEDSRNFEKVQTELQYLSQKPQRSLDEERRVLELLTISEVIAPKEVKSTLAPGYFSSRQAETLYLLGKPKLALAEIEEARRLGSSDSDDLRLFLDILRRVDLPRARREADALAARSDVPAGVLAECVNVLATYADGLNDEEFAPVAGQILAWADRFDRAPGREQVLALSLALFQFNLGLVLLRLGRAEAARDALDLAHSVDPIFAEIGEALQLTAYDHQARDLAERVRVRARPIAA